MSRRRTVVHWLREWTADSRSESATATPLHEHEKRSKMSPMSDLRTAAAVRRACRTGALTGPTPGLALGWVQANLVVLPRDLAFDFLLFCQRNP